MGSLPSEPPGDPPSPAWFTSVGVPGGKPGSTRSAAAAGTSVESCGSMRLARSEYAPERARITASSLRTQPCSDGSGNAAPTGSCKAARSATPRSPAAGSSPTTLTVRASWLRVVVASSASRTPSANSGRPSPPRSQSISPPIRISARWSGPVSGMVRRRSCSTRSKSKGTAASWVASRRAAGVARVKKRRTAVVAARGKRGARRPGAGAPLARAPARTTGRERRTPRSPVTRSAQTAREPGFSDNTGTGTESSPASGSGRRGSGPPGGAQCPRPSLVAPNPPASRTAGYG